MDEESNFIESVIKCNHGDEWKRRRRIVKVIFGIYMKCIMDTHYIMVNGSYMLPPERKIKVNVILLDNEV